MVAAWTAESHGARWRLELDRDELLPGRLVGGRVTVDATSTIEARGLLVTLRGEEHWKYEETTTDSEGRTTTHIRTGHDELARVPVQLEEAIRLVPGTHGTWPFELPVPPLGPATLEADVAGLDWVVEAKLDVPGGLDSAIEAPVRIVQPIALLRAGSVRVGQFALFDSADVEDDGVRGTVTLDPVPLVVGRPFVARVELEAGGARRLQEIRGEVRVHVAATVAHGRDETITAWSGSLPITELEGSRVLELEGVLGPAALPTVELPHGRTEATFHVILATAWARDPHLVRDVAIATTAEL